MDNLFEELGVTTKFVKSTSHDNRFIVLVHRLWLKSLVRDAKLLSNISERVHIDHWTYDSVEPGPSWQKIFISVYRKRSDCKVLPLPRVKLSNNQANSSLIFAQLMELIAETNYKNLWKEAYKKYSSKSDCRETASTNNNVILVDYNDVLRDIISRTYGCRIINTCYEPSTPITHTQFDPHPNILSVLCAVETLNAIFLLHSPFVEHNLNDCVTFSEAILSQCYTKPLFVIYQLLHAMRTMHDRSLTLGEIQLQDVYLTKDLWLMVFPQLLSNIHVMELPEKVLQKSESDEYKLETYGVKMKSPTLNNECLEVLCERWINGGMSNFEYLMALNHLSGRRTGNPNCHPVFPWVTDFSSRCGRSWRDLRKSKFRLNKGDCHLDLTYTNHHTAAHLPTTSSPTPSIAADSAIATAAPLPPHHVSDILSPITYYVYMARRTPRPLLTKHVRPLWVPAEYPASIQRLHAWTPDECVPEFYSDATVFRSVHGDLDDLEVPTWADSAEEFVHRHREMLESARVSERLHYWIDLTFGYKLSGIAAVKAKNVCLNLVDGHCNLTCSGIVQLFSRPHPARISHSPFFGKIPPKIYFQTENKQKTRDNSSSYAAIETSRSEEDNEDDSSSTQRSPLVLSRLKSRSRSSLNESDKLDQQKLSRSPSTGRSLSLGPKTCTLTAHSKSSSTKSSSGQISLPWDYNPAQALINLENKHAFLSSTFHSSDNKKYTFNKVDDNAKSNSIITDDVNENLDLLQNAFTNQFFESKLQYPTKKSFTFPIDGVPSKEYFRRSRSRTSVKNDQRISCNYAEIIASRRVKELQILGCLITEIFLSKQLRPLGNTTPIDKSSFHSRLKACLTTLRSNETLIPLCIKHALNLLLQPDVLDLNNVRFPVVSELGLPPPSAHLLLEPLLHILIAFPKHFPDLYASVKRSKDFNMVTNELNILYYVNCDGKKCGEYEEMEQRKSALARNVAECQVKRFTLDLEQLLPNDAAYIWQEEVQIARLLTPYVREFIEVKESAVLAVWFLFDPIARVLGPDESSTHLLLPLLHLYNPPPNTNHTPAKVAKIYHHSFLLRVIVRLGLRCFLEHFITPLVEAVGGCRDNQENSDTSRFVNRCCCKESISSMPVGGLLWSGDTRGSVSKPLMRIVDDISIVEGEACSDGGSSSDDGKRAAEDEEVFQLEEDTQAATTRLEHTHNHRKRSVTPDAAHDATISANIQHFRELELDLDAGEHQSTQVDATAGVKQVMSPTIPIPGNGKGFSRVDEVGDIQCEYGSKVGIEEGSIEEDALRHQTTDVIASQPVSSSSTTSNHQSSSRSAQISDTSSDSLSWLAHRLGPVLTARYLSRNLLKMLTLCYVGADNLKLLDGSGNVSEVVGGGTVARGKVVGDRCAEKVLESLSNIAALYGEQIILLQYLPHISELITLCKRKLTPNLEGSLISCLALLQYIIPYLSDATLMDQVQDTILKNILHPCIRLLGSTKYSFPNGALARNVLARKYVDTLYILSLRMGADNTRTLLAVPALQRFFLIFDKINDSGYYGQATIQRDVFDSTDSKESLQKSIEESHFVELRRDGTTKEWAIGGRPIQISHVKLRGNDDSNDSLSPPVNCPASTSTACGIFDDSVVNQAIEELQLVFTPALAHMAYVPFLRQIGQAALEQALKNHSTIHNLCVEHEKENTDLNKEPPTNPQLGISSSTTITMIGNRISVRLQQQDITAESLLTTRMANTARHLRGNWLAYWEHEIGRSEKDDGVFDFKQIKLQTFSGHGNAVRAICCVDNENSFLSGSRDKTIKLWSLRSAGDGTASVPCQWTYTGHRKSVLSVAFLPAVRLVGSCDSTGSLHVWDPYLGGVVGQLDGTVRQINVVKAFPAPSTSLLAATTEGSLRVVDVRQCSFVQDLKISMNPTGIIRCIALSPSGAYLAAGQYSGQMTVLDGRTGLIVASWRAHEGEVLQLAFVRETQLISTSLDQMIACWNVVDGKLMYYMKGPSEPVHCLNFYGDSLITGSTANRIGVHSSVSSESTYTGTKLRTDTIRGMLTSTALLPLNRLLLVGADTGAIVLLC